MLDKVMAFDGWLWFDDLHHKTTALFESFCFLFMEMLIDRLYFHYFIQEYLGLFIRLFLSLTMLMKYLDFILYITLLLLNTGSFLYS